VETDKLYYACGEVIKGNIKLNLRKPKDVSSLHITFKGTQHAYYSIKRGDTTYTGESKGDYIDLEQIIQEVNGKMPAGDYVFPFQFAVPFDVPNSFYYGDSKFFGKVEYRLKAELKVPGTFTRNERFTHDIIIATPYSPSKEELSRHTVQSEEDVTYCCCIKKGKVAITANLERLVFSRVDVINVFMDIDCRQCQVEMRGIKVGLHEFLSITTKGHTETTGSIVASTKCDYVPMGANGRRQATLLVPKTSMESLHTGPIDFGYSVFVELKMPSCKSVGIRIPVKVHNLAMQMPDVRL
jgi:hypothetical protein